MVLYTDSIDRPPLSTMPNTKAVTKAIGISRIAANVEFRATGASCCPVLTYARIGVTVSQKKKAPHNSGLKPSTPVTAINAGPPVVPTASPVAYQPITRPRLPASVRVITSDSLTTNSSASPTANSNRSADSTIGSDMKLNATSTLLATNAQKTNVWRMPSAEITCL